MKQKCKRGLWRRIKMGLYKRLKGEELSPLELLMKRRDEPRRDIDPLLVVRRHKDDDI